MMFAPGRWAAPRGFELRRQCQPPQRVVPHALERLPDGPESITVRLVEPVLLIRPAHDEAGFLKRAQLQRHRAKRDVGHGGGDVARCHLLTPDQAEDLTTAWRCDRSKDDVFHFRSNLD